MFHQLDHRPWFQVLKSICGIFLVAFGINRFVVPAGLIYRHHRNYGGAIVGSVVGALLMAVLGFFSNLFIIYPIYTNVMPMEAIMGMYQAINPSVQELWQALLIFNLPFTFCKGLISAVITILVYKKLEPVINGKVV